MTIWQWGVLGAGALLVIYTVALLACILVKSSRDIRWGMIDLSFIAVAGFCGGFLAYFVWHIGIPIATGQPG